MEANKAQTLVISGIRDQARITRSFDLRPERRAARPTRHRQWYVEAATARPARAGVVLIFVLYEKDDDHKQQDQTKDTIAALTRASATTRGVVIRRAVVGVV